MSVIQFYGNQTVEMRVCCPRCSSIFPTRPSHYVTPSRHAVFILRSTNESTTQSQRRKVINFGVLMPNFGISEFQFVWSKLNDLDRLSHLIHCKGFHTESSPGVIYFTITWSCRVTISNFRIFRSNLTVRESIPCTKVGLNTINLVVASGIRSFFS